ncbi:hypothetical protein GCK72_018726 [Caenorhabditis remanei]|uniref:SPK domain-containing protein n=1 Tax=Caenorhabditis remanei TaxID=31234 RepID=A0A6A5GCM0_CAERE|nr:hypothetical protein GCK72_018726 [Caenorhabditis remanei]KAF1752172.1 hypothetical protein GCK72_018726 [Caenorhabditis remanei]
MTMWKFLLKEIVDPITGFIERDRIKAKGLTLWEKFRTEVSDLRTATSLRKRFSMPSFPTPQSMNFDLDSQAKLHYALAIPVDESQLTEFLENADIDLDESSCIIRYKDRRPGGLELRQFVKQRRRRREGTIDFGTPEEKKLKMRTDTVLNDSLEQLNKFTEGDFKLEPVDDSGTEYDDAVFSVESSSNEDEPMQNLLATLQGVIDSSNSEMLDLFRQTAPITEKDEQHSNSQDYQPAGGSTEVSMTMYLESMASLVSNFRSPHLEKTQLKIGNAIEKSRQEDKQLPLCKVKMMMEATLAMMGF